MALTTVPASEGPSGPLPAPLALGAFTPDLMCVFANPEFAGLTGRTRPAALLRGWSELFSETSPATLAELRAVVTGAVPGTVIEVPGVTPLRRRDDPPPVDSNTLAPARYLVHAYRIRDTRGRRLLRVAGCRTRPPWLAPVDLHDVSTPDGRGVRKRLENLLDPATGSAHTVLMTAHIRDNAAGRPGRPGGRMDLPGLTTRLASSFRVRDALALLGGRRPMLACPINDVEEAGLLLDRFWEAVQRWSETAGAPAGCDVEIRMVIAKRGSGVTTLFSELEERLDQRTAFDGCALATARTPDTG